jgi:hypothetical protein
MMDKMVKAVDTTEKTTQNAFTKGFKTLGLQLTFANMLKQSQVFTGTLNAIFQVVGALIDITLAPFMPLIVKFLQKAIPRLLDFAEKMGNWVRGELALLDELGLVGYIKDRLETGVREAFDKFGPFVAESMGNIVEIVVKSIPTTAGIAIRAMGEITGVVIATAITEVGNLMTIAIANVLKGVADSMAWILREMSELRLPGGWQPFSSLSGLADDLEIAGVELRDDMIAAGKKTFADVGEWAGNLVSATFSLFADIIESDASRAAFDALAEGIASFVETGFLQASDKLIEALEGLSTKIKVKADGIDSGDGDTVEPVDRTVGVDPIVKRLWGGNIGMDNEMLEMGGKGLSWGVDAVGGKDAASQLEDSFAHELEYGLRSYNPDLTGVWGGFVPLEAVKDLDKAQKTYFDKNVGKANVTALELAQNIHKYGARNLDKYGNPKSFDALMADDSLDALKGLSWGGDKEFDQKKIDEITDIKQTAIDKMMGNMGEIDMLNTWSSLVGDVNKYGPWGRKYHPIDPSKMPGHKDFGKDPNAGRNPGWGSMFSGIDWVPGNWKKGDKGIGDKLFSFFGSNPSIGGYDQGLNMPVSTTMPWQFNLNLNGNPVGTVEGLANSKSNDTQKTNMQLDLGQGWGGEESWQFG